MIIIDSCQKGVSAEQCHMTVSRAQLYTHSDDVFLKSYSLTTYLF